MIVPIDPASSNVTIAALLGAIMGLIKVLEVTITWAFRRFSTKSEKTEKRVTIVQLDPEVSRALRETSERTHQMHDIMVVKDNDGTPLVYSPRSMYENVSLIASCMKDVTNVQERTVALLEKIEDKVDDNTAAIRELARRKE